MRPEFEPAGYFLGSEYWKILPKLLKEQELEVRVFMINGRTYIDGIEVGLSLSSREDGVIDTTQLLSESNCILPVPFGLSFKSSQLEIRELLGIPDQQREADLSNQNDIPPWDAYFLGDYRIHFEFLPDGNGIKLISIEHKDLIYRIT